MTNGTNKIENNNILLKISAYIITTLITVVITLMGFWMIEGRNLVNRQEVQEMIDLESKTLYLLLQHREEDDKKLEEALKENTVAIQELKLHISVLASKFTPMTGLNDKTTKLMP